MTRPPADKGAGAAAPKPCPICGAPRVARYRPFCSKRCADVDLGRWMTGGYAVAAEETDAPDADDLNAGAEGLAPEPGGRRGEES